MTKKELHSCFAEQAMQVLINRRPLLSESSVAEKAWAYADAMMEKMTPLPPKEGK